mgnify:CR=1 FL=1
MRNIAIIFRSSTVLRAFIGSRAILFSQGMRTLLRAYGVAIMRILLAFVIAFNLDFLFYIVDIIFFIILEAKP